MLKKGKAMSEENVTVEPGRLLKANSLIAVVLCVLFLYYGGTTISSSPFGFVMILMMSPFFIFGAHFQYNLVFRQAGSFALPIVIINCLGTLMLLASLIVSLADIIKSGFQDKSFILLVLTILSTSLYMAFTTILNIRWIKKLPESDDKATKTKNWNLLPFAAAVLALTAGIVCGVHEGNILEVEEGLDSVPWLPETAGNISYCRNKIFGESYEFDISEEGFLDWCKSKGWSPRTITDSFSILRYNFFTLKLEDYEITDEDVKEFDPDCSAQDIPATKKVLSPDYWANLTRAEVSEGYYYEDRQSNGGGCTAVYDNKKGRAYYNYSPR